MIRKNESQTRIVRTYGMDLAIGDVMVTGPHGEYVGTVDSVPVRDTDTARVTFMALTPSGDVEPRSIRDTAVVRIEIARRLS